ncbi:MAG: GH25 family lysozyme [Pseudomonadota bacterium]|nr:GH25 family lysozyme [Pseudomonadota bacterium]
MKLNTKTIFIWCAIAVCSGAALYLALTLYLNGYWRFNYPSASRYPQRGLDVSHHQGEIQWGKINSDIYSFVYIKATEGGDWVDKKFIDNWSQAQATQLKVGAYHFYTFCTAPEVQAKNFIKTVPKLNTSLPPVVDLEYAGNCSKRPSKAEFTAALQVYIELIEKSYDTLPTIYTTTDFYDDYLVDTPFASYPLWLRSVFFEPDFNNFSNVIIWQYSDNNRVEGFETLVDLNILLP